MNDIMLELAKQVPSLAVLVVLVVYFLRALERLSLRFETALDKIEQSLVEDRRQRSDLGGKILTKLEDAKTDRLEGKGCRYPRGFHSQLAEGEGS